MTVTVFNTQAITQKTIRAAQNGNSDAQCELGMHYMKKGDYELAHKWLKRSADKGNIHGIYNLGIYWDKLALDCAEGCRELFQNAFNCFYKSAQKGLTEAQYMLADYYLNGFYNKQNIDSAKIWYEKAAEKNYTKAYFRLALLTPELNKRATLLKKAYESGVQEATHNLALCYFYGEGFNKDINEGLRLLNIAADYGNERSLFELGKIYALGINLKKDKNIADSYFNRIKSLNMIFVGKGKLDNNPISNTNNIPVSKFSIGRYPVTIGLWYAVMGNSKDQQYTPAQDSWPVYPSWTEMHAFIAKLNQITGHHYYLPDDNQWLYAAKGGPISRGYKYAGTNDLNDLRSPSKSIGTTKPNELGIYFNSKYSEWVNKKTDADTSMLEMMGLSGSYYYSISPDYFSINKSETLGSSFRLAENIIL